MHVSSDQDEGRDGGVPAVDRLRPLRVPAQGRGADHAGADWPDQEISWSLSWLPATSSHFSRYYLLLNNSRIIIPCWLQSNVAFLWLLCCTSRHILHPVSRFNTFLRLQLLIHFLSQSRADTADKLMILSQKAKKANKRISLMLISRENK